MRSFGSIVAALASSLLLAGAAQAVQFTPTPTAQLHTLGSGQPGAEWGTSGLGAGGQISYDQNTGLLSMTARLDVMNYWDPGNGACSTDAGSNCFVNFGPDLDITLQAKFVGLTVTPVGGTTVNITAAFTTVGAGWDLTVVDPTTNTTVLQADWANGTFQGQPTMGFSASVLFDTNTNSAGTNIPTGVGFLDVSGASLYASLFQPDFFGITFGAISDFAGAGGGLDNVLAASVLAGTLVSFTAEANGEVLKTASGQFVPEPTTAGLLALGVVALAVRRRRGA